MSELLINAFKFAYLVLIIISVVKAFKRKSFFRVVVTILLLVDFYTIYFAEYLGWVLLFLMILDLREDD